MDKAFIHTLFTRNAELFPAQIALEAPGVKLTYSELDGLSDRLAGVLSEIQGEPGAIIATLLPADQRLIISLLAIFKAGGVYLPMDNQFPELLMQQVLEEGAPEILVTGSETLDEARALLEKHGNAVRALVVVQEDGSCYTIRFDTGTSGDRLPEDAAYVFYTSGSTGKAKAILGSHRGLSHFIHWEIGEFGLDETCRVSGLSQFTFDASLRDIFLPLSTGGTLCLPPAHIKQNLPLLLEWLMSSGISLVHCVPSLFRLLTRYMESIQGRVLPELRHVLMAGEPLFAKDITAWRNRVGEHVELVNLYGTSETTLAKTFHRIGVLPKDPAKALHVGKPISNTAVAIFNGTKLCSPGEIGEIYIKTPFRSKGYLRNEELTNSVFVQNPLVRDKADILHRTGDMGCYREDGFIEVHGRLDDQVKINGIRLELAHMKHAVLSAHETRDAVIIVIPDAEGENRLACYYVGEADEAALREHLGRHFNGGLIPSFFIKLDELPLTINGKVDKKALPRPVIETAAADQPVEETDPLVLDMMRIWKEVLGLRAVSRSTLFFQAGGTSLKAIMVISRLYKQHQVQLKIKDIFDHPSLEGLCDHVRQVQRSAIETIKLVPKAASYETTSAQKGIWLQLEHGKGLAAYNMTGAYHFYGAVGTGVLTDVIAVLMERHEILRTSFVMENGELMQRVWEFDKNDLPVEVEDVRGRNGFDTAALAEAESLRVFDALSERLIRWKVVRLAEDHHFLVVTQHHLVADGWSIELMMKEFLTTLEAFARGVRPQLPALKVQYKDYAVWYNRYIDSAVGKDHLAYWKSRLDVPLEPLDLVTGDARGNVRSYEGRLFAFDLPDALADTVFEWSEQRGRSVFAVLLSLTNVLLYGYTGRENILVGSPFAGRNHPDIEDLLGLFVNILVLRGTVRPEERFSQLLDAVAADAADAYQHGIYPLERTLEHLEQGLRFLNVFVQMQEAHGASLQEKQTQLEDVRVVPAEFRHLSSKFDLTFNFSAHAPTRRISVAIEYDKGLFTERRLIRIREDLFLLLEGLAGLNDLTVADLTGRLPVESNSEMRLINEQINSGISRDY